MCRRRAAGIPDPTAVQFADSVAVFRQLAQSWGREYNVTLAKNTTIREGWMVQFRAEAFNLFNHPIFGGDPDLDPTSANFGKILRNNGQSNFPRQIQLGLRLSF